MKLILDFGTLVVMALVIYGAGYFHGRKRKR